MSHTYEELKKKNVADLREIAKEIEHEAVQGYTQLNKEHLRKAMCTARNLGMDGHHEIKGVDKSKIKKEIRNAKKKRDEAIVAKDDEGQKKARGRIRHLKKVLRKATV